MAAGRHGWRVTARATAHTARPGTTAAPGSVVPAPSPVTSAVTSLGKGVFFLLFSLQWGRAARNNRRCSGRNVSSKWSASCSPLCCQPAQQSPRINVNENLNTHSVRRVTRGTCPAWEVSHKWEKSGHRLQSTAYSII